MNPQFERHSGDEMLHLTLMDGQVRVLLCETTLLTQRAADLHDASPVAAAAMGRLMAGSLMIGVMLKGQGENVSVTIRGDGPLGPLTAVADHDSVRVTCIDPHVQLPLRPDGKLDVGGAVGHHGRMSVVKDMGLRDPYVGQIELVSGEIAMDFAQYFTVSEQQPSLVALGVLTSGEHVLKAGGLLIQPLPGCEDGVIDQLELRSPMFADISRELAAAPKEELAEGWFRGMNPVLLDRTPLCYRCTCSRDRMERVMISLGSKELSDFIAKDEGAKVQCHFCNTVYSFSTEDLRDLLARASAKEKAGEA